MTGRAHVHRSLHRSPQPHRATPRKFNSLLQFLGRRQQPDPCSPPLPTFHSTPRRARCCRIRNHSLGGGYLSRCRGRPRCCRRQQLAMAMPTTLRCRKAWHYPRLLRQRLAMAMTTTLRCRKAWHYLRLLRGRGRSRSRSQVRPVWSTRWRMTRMPQDLQ